MDKPLSVKHERFCREYVMCGNASKAYIAAGFKDSPAAYGNASRLISNDNIKARINELKADVAGTLGISAVMIARELARLGFGDITDVASWGEDGLRPIKASRKLSQDVTRAIAEVKENVTTTTTPDGYEIVNRQIKFKMHEKRPALEALNKMLGYNAPEKQDRTVRIEGESATEKALDLLEALDAGSEAGGAGEADAG